MEHIKKLIGQRIYLSPLQAEDAPQLFRCIDKLLR